MTTEERKKISHELGHMKSSPGGRILMAHIDDEIALGWSRFIDLPVEKKTSKAAYDAQAKYKALKSIKEWLDSEIKLGI